MFNQFRFRYIFALLLTPLLLAACQTQPQIPVTSGDQPITIIGQDYSFEAPDTIPAGLITIVFENQGQQPHHLQLVRLNDGLTPDQFFENLEREGEAAFDMFATGEGGAGVVLNGDSQEITVDLPEGTYLLVSFVPDDQGVPDLVKGMVQPVQVVASGETAQQPIPQADVTIVLDDFSFEMPAELQAGRQVWEVVNEGVQWHEINVVRLAPGATMDDLNAYFRSPDGPPPYMPVGGMNGLSTGKTGWATMDLEPGSYVALCFIPDPGSHLPHLALGMVASFEVR